MLWHKFVILTFSTLLLRDSVTVSVFHSLISCEPSIIKLPPYVRTSRGPFRPFPKPVQLASSASRSFRNSTALTRCLFIFWPARSSCSGLSPYGGYRQAASAGCFDRYVKMKIWPHPSVSTSRNIVSSLLGPVVSWGESVAHFLPRFTRIFIPPHIRSRIRLISCSTASWAASRTFSVRSSVRSFWLLLSSFYTPGPGLPGTHLWHPHDCVHALASRTASSILVRAMMATRSVEGVDHGDPRRSGNNQAVWRGV